MLFALSVRILKYLGVGLICAVASFLAVALIGSLWPVNANWREPEDGVTIHVVSNGYHSGIILPASAAGLDLTLIFRPTDLPDPDDSGNWMVLGWGDRDFFLDTPSWTEFKPSTALVALMGSGRTLLHVEHLKSSLEVPDASPVRLSPDQYRRLVARILAQANRGADGHLLPTPGYGSLDVFYEATGHYSALRTCNVWTAEMLAAAGVKVGRWTPFSEGVMWWFSPPLRPVRPKRPHQ